LANAQGTMARLAASWEEEVLRADDGERLRLLSWRPEVGPGVLQRVLWWPQPPDERDSGSLAWGPAPSGRRQRHRQSSTW